MPGPPFPTVALELRSEATSPFASRFCKVLLYSIPFMVSLNTLRLVLKENLPFCAERKMPPSRLPLVSVPSSTLPL